MSPSLVRNMQNSTNVGHPPRQLYTRVELCLMQTNDVLWCCKKIAIPLGVDWTIVTCFKWIYQFTIQECVLNVYLFG